MSLRVYTKNLIRQITANFALGLNSVHQLAKDTGSTLITDDFLAKRYEEAMAKYENLYDTILAKEPNPIPKKEYMRKMSEIQKRSNENLRNIAGYGTLLTGAGLIGGTGYNLYRASRQLNDKKSEK